MLNSKNVVDGNIVETMKTLLRIGNDQRSVCIVYVRKITRALFQFDRYNKEEQFTSVFHFQAKGTFQR